MNLFRLIFVLWLIATGVLCSANIPEAEKHSALFLRPEIGYTCEFASASIRVDAAGNLLHHGEYSAFGRDRYSESTTAFPVSRRFTGQVKDEDTGLYYYGARYYDPVLARFMQPDTIIPDLANPQSYNRYAYVLNNPLRYTDPDGHDPAMAPGIGMFQRLNARQHVEAARLAAPPAVGLVVGVGTAGFATPLLVGAGASTTFAAMGAGMAGGAAGDLAAQGTQIALGQRQSVSGREVAASALLGGVLSGGASKLGSWKAGTAAKAETAAAKTAPIRWSPLNGPGPLGEKVAGTFRGGSYTELTTSEATTLYRVYGGNSPQIGPYWTRTPPAGPLQSTIDSALNPAWGNTANNVVRIQVPAGTRIFEGFAAPQGGLVGGGNQVFIQNVNPSWIVP